MANEDLGPALFKKGCFYLVCLHAGMGEPQGLPSTRFHPKLKGDYVIPLFGGKFFSHNKMVYHWGNYREHSVILTYLILVSRYRW